MFNTALAVHVAAGSVALLSMFVPMVARKGGRLHRRAGWTFVGSMAIVSATAFVLSMALWSLFLLVVTLVTANGVWSAVTVLRRKGTTPHGQWAVQHISSILGSCIAATTAFLVNTADDIGIWLPAAWLAPGVIGVPVIRIWVGSYTRRLAAHKEKSMTPVSTFAREAAGVTLLALLIFSPAAVSLFAQAPLDLRRGPDLVGGLKATPGVLGVETAQTSSGKQVIFAWFEDKQAVLNWHYSETHQTAMRLFAPGGASDRAPLAHIRDDSGPILAIASLTIVDTPQVGGVSLPVSQIAIELYAPLPGGLAAGGTFAPAALKVPGLIEVQ